MNKHPQLHFQVHPQFWCMSGKSLKHLYPTAIQAAGNLIPLKSRIQKASKALKWRWRRTLYRVGARNESYRRPTL